MYREDRFVMSHRGYAVDLGSLHLESRIGLRGEYFIGEINAVWFRRKNGVAQAVVGELHDSQWDIPMGAVQFLKQYTDGRYGGRPFARWDGASLWCAGQDPEENARYLELLRPMLENFPAVPDGHDGWYVFAKGVA